MTGKHPADELHDLDKNIRLHFRFPRFLESSLTGKHPADELHYLDKK